MAKGQYSGLNLWIVENHIRYSMKIWRNFAGVSYYSRPVMSDSKGKAVKQYGDAPRDYATAFEMLRLHFNLKG